MGEWLGDTLTLIDLFVVFGVACILPLAVPTRWWLLVAPSTAVAVFVADGVVAAGFVLPWIALGCGLTVRALARSGLRFGIWTLEDGADVVRSAFGVVAAVWLAQSRLGLELFGVREPIVELTAVHFTYAGVGALTLARLNLLAQPGAWARAAVALTAGAPPVVALGFVTEVAVAQVGGAVLMTGGVWLTGSLHLRSAARRGWPTAGRILLAASGAAVWLPMVLAVAWAAGQHWDVPAMSIADMARVHGTLNAVGFTLCGLLAWHVRRRRNDESSRDRSLGTVSGTARAAAAGGPGGGAHL